MCDLTWRFLSHASRHSVASFQVSQSQTQNNSQSPFTYACTSTCSLSLSLSLPPSLPPSQFSSLLVCLHTLHTLPLLRAAHQAASRGLRSKRRLPLLKLVLEEPCHLPLHLLALAPAAHDHDRKKEEEHAHGATR